MDTFYEWLQTKQEYLAANAVGFHANQLAEWIAYEAWQEAHKEGYKQGWDDALRTHPFGTKGVI